MNEIITTTVIATVTGFLGWIFSKLQTRNERRKSEEERIDAAYDTWNKIVSSLREQISTLVEDNTKMKDKMDVMNSEIEQLREEIKSLRVQNKQINSLKKKIELYEKILTENQINF